MTVSVERRSRRSDDLFQALHYLLATQRERAGLTHMVLATSDGFLLAHDGDREDCEEFAAYAPFIARGEGFLIDARRTQGLAAYEFAMGSDVLFLLLRGGQPTESAAATVMSSIEGTIRILKP